MIYTQTLRLRLTQMPPALQQEVLDFMEFLIRKYDVQRKRPTFGSAREKYRVAPDFDAPLDDFKEYM